jgi:type II secretion system protein H
VAAGLGNGFTLVELILVMAMLVIVIAVAAPSLSNFFRGRGVDSEARRFLSLTRYGQSRAVSEGVPMVLWVDAEGGAYGLTQESGYTDNDEKAIDVTVDEHVRLDVPDGFRYLQNGRNLAAIHFSPDGGISTTSFSSISMQEGDNPPVWIVQSANELNYEIEDPKKLSGNVR